MNEFLQAAKQLGYFQKGTFRKLPILLPTGAARINPEAMPAANPENRAKKTRVAKYAV